MPSGPLYTTTDFSVVATSAALCADTFSNAITIEINDIIAPVIECPGNAMLTIEEGNCDPSLMLGAPVNVTDNCVVASVTYTLSGATVASSPNTGFNDASDEDYAVGFTTVEYTALDSFGNMAACQFVVEVIDNSQPLVDAEAMDMTVECDGMGNTAAFNAWLAGFGGASVTAPCSNLTWSTIPANPSLSDDCGETGSVTVTFLATDENGFTVSSTATFTIEDTQAPTFTVPADITILENEDENDLLLTGTVTDEEDGCDQGVVDGGLREAIYTDSLSSAPCEILIYRTWTLTDECGNSTEQTQLITKEDPVAEAGITGNVSICAGDEATLTFSFTGGGGNFNLIYTDGDNEFPLNNVVDGFTISVFPTETTTYSLVSVTDLAFPDCIVSLTTTAEVTTLEVPQVNDLEIVCNALNTAYVVSFQLSGGDPGTYAVGGNTGTLANGFFASDPIPRDSMYTFIIEDGNACTATVLNGTYDCACVTDAGVIEQNSLTVCGSETITIENNSFNLDPNDILQYVLHDGDAGMIGTVLMTLDNPEVTYDNSLMYGVTYYLTAVAGTTSGNGTINTNDLCLSESTGVPIIFYEPPSPVVSPITDYELSCSVEELSFSGTNSSGQGGLSYFWTVLADGNITSNPNLSMVTVDDPGTYQLLITDNATSCTATTTFVVTIDEDYPVANIQTTPILNCYNEEVELDGSGSSVGADFAYQWTGGTIEDGSQTLEPTISQSAFYTLIVTDTSNGCSTSATAFVEEDVSPPQVDAGAAQSLDCLTTELTLNGSYTAPTSNIVFQWTTDNGNIVDGANTFTPTVDAVGVYILEVTNQDNGCTGEDDVVISVDINSPQGAFLQIDDPDCYGEEDGVIAIDSIIGGTGPYVYSIDGTNFYPQEEFVRLPAGEYNFVVQDALGCEWDTLVSLQNPSELTVELSGASILNLGDSTELEAFVNQPIDTFIWLPGSALSCDTCLQTFVQPENQASYQIIVTDANGCTAMDALTISVRKDRAVYIPTVFTPNGDGNNDYLTIYSDQSVVNIPVFRIYNRWGALLFEQEDFLPNNDLMGWNGRFKGKELQPGVYIYYAEIEFFDGLREVYKGDVTIMK